MSESEGNAKFNRRSLLLGAIFLVGGAAALTRFGRGDARALPDGKPALSSEQFALLEQVADIIIPTTDTPGALAAGVPAYLRQLLTNWASQKTRDQFSGLLDVIDKRAWAKYGTAFLELAPDRRFEIMRDFDEEMVTSENKDYRRMKFLVLLGYYHSEVGASQELRFELVPGAWRPCVPLSEIGRATAV